MERMTGIEPVSSAWKAEVLPLYHIRIKWSGRRDSNSRPSPWQGDALPLSHFRVIGGGRWIRTIESSANGFTVRPLWPLGNPSMMYSKNKMELAKRIELPTCWLQISCSTVEPRQRVSYLSIITHFLRFVKHFLMLYFERYLPQSLKNTAFPACRTSCNLSACSLYDTQLWMSTLNFHFF